MHPRGDSRWNSKSRESTDWFRDRDNGSSSWKPTSSKTHQSSGLLSSSLSEELSESSTLNKGSTHSFTSGARMMSHSIVSSMSHRPTAASSSAASRDTDNSALYSPGESEKGDGDVVEESTRKSGSPEMLKRIPGKSKATILDELEHFDIEIEEIEEEMRKLKNELENLEAENDVSSAEISIDNPPISLAPSEGPVPLSIFREEILSYAKSLDERPSSPSRVISHRIIAENQMHARFSQEEYVCHVPTKIPAYDGEPYFNSAHEAVATQIMRDKILDETRKDHLRKQELVREYKEHRKVWKQNLIAEMKSQSKQAVARPSYNKQIRSTSRRPTITSNITSSIPSRSTPLVPPVSPRNLPPTEVEDSSAPQFSVARSTRTGRVSNRFTMSDAVRSEEEFLKILEQLKAEEDENPELRYLRTLAKIPDMITNPMARERKYFDNNHLVEDAAAAQRDYKHLTMWSDVQKKIYVEKFAIYGRNFRKLSSFIPNKSISDCIEFYYRHKHQLKLKKLYRNHQAKKHRVASMKAPSTPKANPSTSNSTPRICPPKVAIFENQEAQGHTSDSSPSTPVFDRSPSPPRTPKLVESGNGDVSMSSNAVSIPSLSYSTESNPNLHHGVSVPDVFAEDNSMDCSVLYSSEGYNDHQKISYSAPSPFLSLPQMTIEQSLTSFHASLEVNSHIPAVLGNPSILELPPAPLGATLHETKSVVSALSPVTSCENPDSTPLSALLPSASSVALNAQTVSLENDMNTSNVTPTSSPTSESSLQPAVEQKGNQVSEPNIPLHTLTEEIDPPLLSSESTVHPTASVSMHPTVPSTLSTPLSHISSSLPASSSSVTLSFSLKYAQPSSQSSLSSASIGSSTSPSAVSSAPPALSSTVSQGSSSVAAVLSSLSSLSSSSSPLLASSSLSTPSTSLNPLASATLSSSLTPISNLPPLSPVKPSPTKPLTSTSVKALTSPSLISSNSGISTPLQTSSSSSLTSSSFSNSDTMSSPVTASASSSVVATPLQSLSFFPTRGASTSLSSSSEKTKASSEKTSSEKTTLTSANNTKDREPKTPPPKMSKTNEASSKSPLSSSNSTNDASSNEESTRSQSRSPSSPPSKHLCASSPYGVKNPLSREIMRLGIGIDSPYWSVEPQPRRRPQKFETDKEKDKDKDNLSLAERTRSSDRKSLPRGRVIRIPLGGAEEMLDEDDRDTESAPSEEDVDPLHQEEERGTTSSADAPPSEKRDVESNSEKTEQIKKEIDIDVGEPAESSKEVKKRLGSDLPGLPKKKYKKTTSLSQNSESETGERKKKVPRKKERAFDGEKGVDLVFTKKEEELEGAKWKENAQKMKVLIGGNEAPKKAGPPKTKTVDKVMKPPPKPRPPPTFSPLRPPDLSPLAHRPQMGLTHPIPTLNPHPLPSFPLPSFPHPSIHHSRLLSPGKFEEFLYAVQEKGRYEYQSLELKPPSIPKPRKKRVEKKANGEPTAPGSVAVASANSSTVGAGAGVGVASQKDIPGSTGPKRPLDNGKAGNDPKRRKLTKESDSSPTSASPVPPTPSSSALTPEKGECKHRCQYHTVVKKGTEVKIPCKAVYANPYEHMSLPHPCPEDCQPCLRNKRKATKHLMQKAVAVPLPLKSLIPPSLPLTSLVPHPGSVGATPLSHAAISPSTTPSTSSASAPLLSMTSSLIVSSTASRMSVSLAPSLRAPLAFTPTSQLASRTVQVPTQGAKVLPTPAKPIVKPPTVPTLVEKEKDGKVENQTLLKATIIPTLIKKETKTADVPGKDLAVKVLVGNEKQDVPKDVKNVVDVRMPIIPKNIIVGPEKGISLSTTPAGLGILGESPALKTSQQSLVQRNEDLTYGELPVVPTSSRSISTNAQPSPLVAISPSQANLAAPVSHDLKYAQESTSSLPCTIESSGAKTLVISSSDERPTATIVREELLVVDVLAQSSASLSVKVEDKMDSVETLRSPSRTSSVENATLILPIVESCDAVQVSRQITIEPSEKDGVCNDNDRMKNEALVNSNAASYEDIKEKISTLTSNSHDSFTSTHSEPSPPISAQGDPLPHVESVTRQLSSENPDHSESMQVDSGEIESLSPSACYAAHTESPSCSSHSADMFVETRAEVSVSDEKLPGSTSVTESGDVMMEES